MNAAAAAALGLDPVVYLSADPALETTLNVVVERALAIQEEWREDLAIRIINLLAKNIRMK